MQMNDTAVGQILLHTTPFQHWLAQLYSLPATQVVLSAFTAQD